MHPAANVAIPLVKSARRVKLIMPVLPLTSSSALVPGRYTALQELRPYGCDRM
jgi:hypothetical protein